MSNKETEREAEKNDSSEQQAGGLADSNSKKEKEVSFVRRALIHAGWAAPVIMAVRLPAHAQASPAPHTDSPHDDTAPHDDAPHNDTPHDDAPHDDAPHDDHADGGLPHVDAGHVDVGHADVPHVDAIG
jgi:hypothetical protein